MLGAVFAAGQPADAGQLTITPLFDSSWTSGFMGGPAAPTAATTAVNNVISEYEADFPTDLTAASKPVSITVAFGWGEIGG
jgi:hypothetical protein